jgi:hypothetical protein
VHVRGPLLHVQVLFPGSDVTVYWVIVLPPVLGPHQVTVASASPAEACGARGLTGLKL